MTLRSSVTKKTVNVAAGKITAKKAGKAKVYVKKGGVTYTYNVVVKKSSKLKAA